MKFGKWIGGGLGWAFGGPIGAILGFAIGSMFDRAGSQLQAQQAPGSDYAMGLSDFDAALVVLTAAVMQSDKALKKVELDFVKRFFLNQFGEKKAQSALLVLRDVLKKDFSVYEVCAQIRSNTNHATRLQLMHYLFGIALADGELHVVEEKMLREIAKYLYISLQDYNSIREMYEVHGKGQKPREETYFSDPYTILQVPRTASDDEIKKAYKKLAMKYHPDKVDDKSEAAQNSAKEMFQNISNAYAQIKHERKFS